MAALEHVDDLSGALDKASLDVFPVIKSIAPSDWLQRFSAFLDDVGGVGARVRLDGVVGFPEASNVSGFARLYAALTGRVARSVSSDPHLWPDELSVLFGTVKDIDSRCLDRLLCASESGRPIGLIVGRDRIGTYLASLSALASLSVKSHPQPLFIDMIGDAHFGILRSGARIVAGGALSAHDSLELLNANADILRIRAHSDGFDATLPGGILCTAKYGEPQDHDAPICIRNGFCYRVNRQLPEIFEDQRLISIAQFKARLVVLDMCQSIVPSDLPFAARFGLFCKASEHPAILASLATPDYSVNHDFETDNLSAKIACGLKIKQALGAYYQESPNVEDIRSRFVVLGDPEYKPCTPGTKSFAEIRADRVPNLTSKIMPQSTVTRDRTAKALEIGSAFWGRTIEAAVQDGGPPFRIEQAGPCYHCGQPARKMNHSNRRKTYFCLRCGPTFHGPQDRSIPRVGLARGQISAIGLNLNRNWVGFALSWGYHDSHHRSVPWISLANGLPATWCPLPRDTEAPVRRVGYVFVDDEFQFLSLPTMPPEPEPKTVA